MTTLRKTCEMMLAYDEPCHQPTTHARYVRDGIWSSMCQSCADNHVNTEYYIVKSNKLIEGGRVRWEP